MVDKHTKILAFIFVFFMGVASLSLLNDILSIFDKDITMRNFDKCYEEFYEDFYIGEIRDLDILRDCIILEKVGGRY